MTFARLVVIVLPFAFIAGCDSVGENEGEGGKPIPDPPLMLEPSGAVTVDVNNFHIRVDSSGDLSESAWYPVAPTAATPTYAVFSAGLWISALQNGQPRVNIVWVGTYPRGNFIAEHEGERSGVYYLTPEDIEKEVAGWPVELGAPAGPNDQPIIYGGAMAWSSLESVHDRSASVLDDPLVDIRVSQAVYGYKHHAIEDALFIRYEIANKSGVPLEDAYVGFHADMDLTVGSDCGKGGSNDTGYDREVGFTYTYHAHNRGDSVAVGCPASVIAATFLESPTGSSPSEAVDVHREMRKNNYVDPDFGERTLTEVENIRNALKGLSNSGAPMVNPVTGEETKFAFTGDPVTEEGWLDIEGGIDVRSLISAGPFSVQPGESATVTVLLVHEASSPLSSTLFDVRQTIRGISLIENLWRF